MLTCWWFGFGFGFGRLPDTGGDPATRRGRRRHPRTVSGRSRAWTPPTAMPWCAAMTCGTIRGGRSSRRERSWSGCTRRCRFSSTPTTTARVRRSCSGCTPVSSRPRTKRWGDVGDPCSDCPPRSRPRAAVRIGLGQQRWYRPRLGMIVERFAIDATRAFELLVKLSQDSNTRLVDVATGLAARGLDPKS